MNKLLAVIILVCVALLTACGDAATHVVIRGRVLAIGPQQYHGTYNAATETSDYIYHYTVAFQHDVGGPAAYSFCATGFKGFQLKPDTRYLIVYSGTTECDTIERVVTL